MNFKSRTSRNIENVYSITNLTLDASNRTDTETNNLLSKAATGTATVAVGTAGQATEAEIDSMVTYVANIATDGITGTALTVTDTQFVTLNSKLNSSITTLTVNAAGATAAELTAISTAITASATKVDEISNLVITAATQTDTETANLLGKAVATATGKATVVATGATAAEVASMVTAISATKIADYGITGTLPITSAVNGTNAADITSLLAKYVGVTATVNANSMTSTNTTGQLDVVALPANIAKIGTITGVMALTANQDATELAALFSKDDAVADATVTAIGGGAGVATVLAANAGKIATNGITGAIMLPTL